MLNAWQPTSSPSDQAAPKFILHSTVTAKSTKKRTAVTQARSITAIAASNDDIAAILYRKPVRSTEAHHSVRDSFLSLLSLPTRLIYLLQYPWAVVS